MPMHVVCCQTDITWEDKAANHAKVRALLAADPPPRGGLVVLPEMFATGFSMDVARIAEGPAGETHEFLAALAAEYAVFLVAGVVSSSPDGRGRNESVVYGPDGSELARYRKIHPFALGGEADHYEPGDAPVLFEWGDFVVAPFVCYDLRFPEIFRAAVRQGATLFTVIANWPVARVHHWTTLLQARAIENQAYVVGVNRVGEDPGLSYPGRSMIIDPGGAILADGRDTERLVRADVDPTTLAEYREQLPFLRDMRTELSELR